MKKRLVIIFLVWCGLVASVVLLNKSDMKSCDIWFSNNGKDVLLSDVLIAKTESDIMKGLSGEKDVKNGMLFVWDDVKLRTFWMKNTFVDLSIGFFDGNNELFDIQNMAAQSLAHHISSKKAKMALELNQNLFNVLGLDVGAKIMKVDCS